MLPAAGQRSSYSCHTAILKICSTCDSKIIRKKRFFHFLKDILKLESGYKVINKEAAELLKTKINDRYESGSIDIQNLIKARNHPKKRVNNFLDTDALNSAENALAELFIKLEDKEAINGNDQFGLMINQ